ncbi:hypothetical protein AW27_015605 [Streptomyces sp. PCS3-D2]|uniref:hypothetical protein n=1 Tax=Streptomyces sp. PCS3-D2 TaxID=1460244 RepID=UPI00044829BF|nr:hypothetical protein [Streptomyces sp. PCS3-D2]WKV72832.1 hypothetical protein AW27_015605 [Streptomyces sp. PCS3-D2]
MRSIRRTALRTAAVVVAGVACVLALPGGSAFADSPAAPGKEALPGAGRPSAGPPAGAPVDPKHRPAPEVRTFAAAVRLADGSVAKVYRIGTSHFEADVFAGSARPDTLVSRAEPASYGRSDGLHVVLRPDGTVTSWLDGEPTPKATPQPKPAVKKQDVVESSVRVALPDGRIAKLVDGPRGVYVVVSTPNGNVLGTLDPKRPGMRQDGWAYEIARDGKRFTFVVIDGAGGGNGWVYDFDGRLIARYPADAPKPGKHRDRAVPSSGGAAATDAAGLGFAVIPLRG